ncbi:MAG: hypothetical protein U1G05_19150 [Kiritimatiellia bacterium]
MRFLPIFVSGCAAGAGICAALVSLREPAPAAPAATIVPAGPSPRETALGAQVDRLEKQVDRLQKDLIAARAEAASPPVATPPEKAAPAAPAVAGTPQKKQAEGVPDFLKGLLSGLPSNAVVTVNGQPGGGDLGGIISAPMREQAVKTAATRARYYSAALGLTPDQEKLLGEQFLEDQPNDLNDLSRIIGNQVKKAMDPGAAEKESQDKLAAILSADQVRQLESLRAGERQAGREADALEEVARVRRAVPDLSMEQREQIYNRALEKGPKNPVEHLLSGDGGAAAGTPYDDLLTPGQRQAYEALSEDGFTSGSSGFSMRTKTIVVPGP